ncbi:MAG: hypothetical protein KC777_00455 [Cyanobacteria bacterium HKST-UBA02]|nr:hypothetical protein [Cyanobacteria bacterium HKST-UBA02]
MTRIVYRKKAKGYAEELLGFGGVNTYGGKSASGLKARRLEVLGKRKWQDFDRVACNRFISGDVRSVFESHGVEAEYYPVTTDAGFSPFLFVPLSVQSVIDPENSKLDTDHFLRELPGVDVIAARFKHIKNEPPLYLDMDAGLILVRDDLAREIESRKFSGVSLVPEGVDNTGLMKW